MNSEQLQTRHNTWLGGETKESSAPIGLWLAGAGGVVVLLLTGILGYRVGHASVPSLQTDIHRLAQQGERDGRQIATLQHQIHALVTGQRHCGTYDGDARSIQRFLAKGQYRAAADLANLDLSNPTKPACVSSGLAQLWYTASMDDLYASASTSPVDSSSVLAWRGIEVQANSLGIGAGSRFSPLTVSTMAYNGRLWALARAAFQRAWAQALVGPSDLAQLATYYAATRNLGRELARQYHGTIQRTGYRLLRTAALIAQHASLGRGEAAADLQQLLGARAATIAPDQSDPVLVRLRPGH